MLIKRIKRIRRHHRVRAKVRGTKDTPRLCVTKSNQHIYAQLIDDESSKTIAAASSKGLKKIGKAGAKQKDSARTAGAGRAFEVGQMIAKKAQDKKVEKVVFDRGGYQYHGVVKALAEGARLGGLKF
jgi:large subunit ribosomal protein L18